MIKGNRNQNDKRKDTKTNSRDVKNKQVYLLEIKIDVSLIKCDRCLLLVIIPNYSESNGCTRIYSTAKCGNVVNGLKVKSEFAIHHERPQTQR